MPKMCARGRELITLALARPALLRGPHKDEMYDKAGEQIQPAFNKGLHTLWQTHRVRHVS